MSADDTTVTLADLCDLIAVQCSPGDVPDAKYLGLEHLAPRRMRSVACGRAADAQSDKSIFRRGDVLYGKLRPYLDKAVLADSDGVCTTELLVLRPKAGVAPHYLACVVHDYDFVEHAMAGVTGAHHPRTSWNHISTFRLPRHGEHEQKAIARLLWRIHDLVEACERSTEAGLRLKSAANRELFTRGLRGEVQTETQIGVLPQSWDVASLGKLGRVGNGSTPKKDIESYWNGGTYPWLTSAKVYDRDIVAADQFVTEQALTECHLPRVSPGAILIAITGQGKTLGHCAVLRTEATINQHIAYVAIDTKRADPSFVRGYLETQYEYLRQVASGGGSTKGALTCAFLRDLPIPMPATIEEQREIVTILDALDRKIDLHRKKLRLLDELFKAVLRKLLAKHMRVEELDLSVVAAHTANTLHISEAGTDEFTLGTGSDTSGGESERGVER